jgi:hypothetical protein
MFTSKYHCWACGGIFCSKCCPEDAVVEEIKSLGKKKVCVQCNYGQVWHFIPVLQIGSKELLYHCSTVTFSMSRRKFVQCLP